jgi:predicted nucleic-acid-binding Zn-ribbon protein
MNKQPTSFFDKSISTSGNSASASSEMYVCPCCGKHEHTPNAVTVAAHKEVLDIKSGKKQTKTYHSAEEFLADLNT